MRLENVREKCAFVIEILAAIICIIFPPAATALPIITYDITRSRNYPGLALVIIAFLRCTGSPVYDTKTILYVLTVILLSVIISIYTEEKNTIKRDYRKLRDDSEEKNTLLRSRNTELLQARDTEIYNAQLSERNRIAREIHDNVGHTLSRAILQMGALLAIHKEEPVHSELEGVRQTLDDAMNSIRSSVHDLHDDSIDVRSNIIGLCEPLKGTYNLHMDIDIGDDTPRPVKYAIIGITKECVSNIIKHSSNTDVDIRLNEHPSIYQLIIHDYNQETGLTHSSNRRTNSDTNEDSINEPGMGLENIRGRVESVNGTLHITNENGFRIFVSIPK
jgi:signal transduction histidine kinase